MAKAAEAAYAVIRAGILTGEFARGQRLREEELATRAGVSRTPIREALRRLDAEGLIDFTPNRGARVTAWSERELEDLYDARALLEGHSAKLAATRISPGDLDELADVATQMEVLAARGAEAADDLTVLNGLFHRAVARASGNSQLESLVRGIIDVPLVHRTFQRYSPERLLASTFHHRELVQALRAGDGEWAEAVMRGHILAARTTVLSSMRQESEAGSDASATDA
jgi:DNA-binding GntR family transcriptional regulator